MGETWLRKEQATAEPSNLTYFARKMVLTMGYTSLSKARSWVRLRGFMIEVIKNRSETLKSKECKDKSCHIVYMLGIKFYLPYKYNKCKSIK